MFRTGAQMFLLVLLAGLFLLRETRSHPVATMEEGFANSLAVADREVNRFLVARNWRPPATTVAPVTLVAINDSSLSDHPWPWTPLDFSLFLQAARPFQPEVTAIEQNLDWARVKLSPADRQKLPQYERILRDALHRVPKILLGQRLGWPDDPDTRPPLREAPVIRSVYGNLREVPEWTVIEEQPTEEFRLSATVGFTNHPYDPTAFSAVPLVLRYQGQIVPSFVLQAVVLWQRLNLDEVQVVLGSHIQLGDKLRIPVDARGRLRVNFGVPFTRFGFDDLLLAAEQVAAKQKAGVPVEKMTGGITLLARTDRAAQTLRLPWRAPLAKGDLYAAAIATIQTKAFMSRPPEWFGFAVVGLAAVTAFWIPRWRKKPVAWWCLGLLAAYVAAAFLFFDLRGLCLPIFLPAGLLAFIALYRAATPNYVWKLREPVIF